MNVVSRGRNGALENPRHTSYGGALGVHLSLAWQNVKCLFFWSIMVARREGAQGGSDYSPWRKLERCALARDCGSGPDKNHVCDCTCRFHAESRPPGDWMPTTSVQLGLQGRKSGDTARGQRKPEAWWRLRQEMSLKGD
jgi:hypothetical protein